jgi:predicted unusual protein kinase regulating ubiquinone biosynthesis (AarF/ABC1/UbiB family)
MNSLRKKVINFFTNAEFILSMGWIFASEYFKYIINLTTYAQIIRALSHRLAEKNILYVKFFQAIAMNNNFIDENINSELLTFTDNVPYCKEDIDYLLLEKLQYRHTLQIDKNNPINSGMISLVYKAKKMGFLPNDSQENPYVIIKIKRKHIAEKLYYAIQRFQCVLDLLSFIPMYNSMNIPFTVRKTLDIMIQQLDFCSEVKNTQEMREKCKHMEYIKIPFVHEEVTNMYPDAIMMEYIDGLHLSKVDKEDYEIFAKQVLKYGFITSFMGGISHGDLHSGNILFIKQPDINGTTKYKIAPIDFGIVTRTSENTKLIMIEIASEMMTCDTREMAEKLVKVLLDPPDLKNVLPIEHYTRLIVIIAIILQETIHSKNAANQFQIYEFFKRFNDFLSESTIKKYNIKVNEDFIKIQVAITMANGISMTLCKNDFINVANAILCEIFHLNLFM